MKNVNSKVTDETLRQSSPGELEDLYRAAWARVRDYSRLMSRITYLQIIRKWKG